jgi:ATP-dependent RNA helicase SUPV3L1/SUV3
LQGRIAAIRSWAYIAQRPDWVLAKEEMAARARGVEARLSDALHARLTERFVNRRTAVLMKKLGTDDRLFSFRLDGTDVLVEDQHIGTLEGFSFRVDPEARDTDRKLLLAAAERHMPALLEERAQRLADAIDAGTATLELKKGCLLWEGRQLATLAKGRSQLSPRLVPDRSLEPLSPARRNALLSAAERWIGKAADALAPLEKLEQASTSPDAGPELRALLIRLVEAGGMLARKDSDIERLDKGQRTQLARLGVRVGALDLFVPKMLRSQPLKIWKEMAAATRAGAVPAIVLGEMPPALAARIGPLPAGYRRAGLQWIRLDMAEKLLREAHEVRVKTDGKRFVIDPALAISMGLSTASFAKLLRMAGFVALMPNVLGEGAYGPLEPLRWRWRPPRRTTQPSRSPTPDLRHSAFAPLSELVR